MEPQGFQGRGTAHLANPPKQELKALARLAGTAQIKRTFPER